MLRETIAFFFVLAALAGIGFGPSIWLLPAGGRRLAHAAAIAPAVGYALIGLLGFPLVRYVGPAEVWSWPVTVLLLLASLGAAALYWFSQHRDHPRAQLRRQDWAILGGSAVLLLVLCGPLLLNGINYVIFRSNPSDLFLQMSLAEQLRAANWQTIVGGVEMSTRNLEGLRQLAAASPTAIFSARTILSPIGLSKVVSLSWAAEIARVPVYRFYYVHYLLAYSMAFLLSLAIGALLKLPRHLNFLAAVVVALGFWARFVLETDAGYEISALPVLLLAVYAWIRLEQSPAHVFSGPRLLLAIAGAVTFMFYFPLIPILAVGFVVYYGLALWQREVPLRAVVLHGVTAGFAVGALAITGQLDFAFRNAIYLITNSSGEAQYPSVVLQVFKADAAAAVMGFPISSVAIFLPRIAHVLVQIAAQVWALGLGIVLVLAGLQLLRKLTCSWTAARIVVSTLAGGLLIGAAFYLVFHNARAAGKAFTYVYPYFVLSLATAPQLLAGNRLARVQPLASSLVALWFLGQAVLGAGLPYTHILPRIFGEPQRPQDYQLAPVLNYLDEHPPKSLLVAIPRASVWRAAAPNSTDDTQWMFPYYAMYAFDRYPAYFQSGIIVDNRDKAQNMWLQSLKQPPDYAVILKSVDYIGPQHLGTSVAETPDLRLYRLSVQDPAPYQAAEEQLFQKRESETVCFQAVCVPPGTYPLLSARP